MDDISIFSVKRWVALFTAIVFFLNSSVCFALAPSLWGTGLADQYVSGNGDGGLFKAFETLLTRTDLDFSGVTRADYRNMRERFENTKCSKASISRELSVLEKLSIVWVDRRVRPYHYYLQPDLLGITPRCRSRIGHILGNIPANCSPEYLQRAASRIRQLVLTPDVQEVFLRLAQNTSSICDVFDDIRLMSMDPGELANRYEFLWFSRIMDITHKYQDVALILLHAKDICSDRFSVDERSVYFKSLKVRNPRLFDLFERLWISTGVDQNHNWFAALDIKFALEEIVLYLKQVKLKDKKDTSANPYLAASRNGEGRKVLDGICDKLMGPCSEVLFMDFASSNTMLKLVRERAGGLREQADLKERDKLLKIHALGKNVVVGLSTAQIEQRIIVLKQHGMDVNNKNIQKSAEQIEADFALRITKLARLCNTTSKRLGAIEKLRLMQMLQPELFNRLSDNGNVLGEFKNLVVPTAGDVELTFYGGGEISCGGIHIKTTVPGSKTPGEEVNLMLDFGSSMDRSSEIYHMKYMRDRVVHQGIRDKLVNGLLPRVKGLYRFDLTEKKMKVYGKNPALDAQLITHPHMDHIGNLAFIRPDIPVWVSPETWAALRTIDHAGADLSKEFFEFEDRENARTIKRDIRVFEYDKPFYIKGVEVIAKKVDHSAVGACAFFVKTAQGWVCYVGDLRMNAGVDGQGKLYSYNHLTEDFIQQANGKDLVALFMEGTNFDKEHCGDTEQDIYNGALDVFDQAEGKMVVSNFNFLNIERMKNFLAAAKLKGRRLVISSKEAYLLENIKEVYLRRYLATSGFGDFADVAGRVGMDVRYVDYEQDREVFEDELLRHVMLSLPDYMAKSILEAFRSEAEAEDCAQIAAGMGYKKGTFPSQTDISFARLSDWLANPQEFESRCVLWSWLKEFDGIKKAFEDATSLHVNSEQIGWSDSKLFAEDVQRFSSVVTKAIGFLDDFDQDALRQVWKNFSITDFGYPDLYTEDGLLVYQVRKRTGTYDMAEDYRKFEKTLFNDSKLQNRVIRKKDLAGNEFYVGDKEASGTKVAPGSVVLCLNTTEMAEVLGLCPRKEPVFLIYSQGYPFNVEMTVSFEKMNAWIEDAGIRGEQIKRFDLHASGHLLDYQIDDMARTINPSSAYIVHTLDPEKFAAHLRKDGVLGNSGVHVPLYGKKHTLVEHEKDFVVLPQKVAEKLDPEMGLFLRSLTKHQAAEVFNDLCRFESSEELFAQVDEILAACKKRARIFTYSDKPDSRYHDDIQDKLAELKNLFSSKILRLEVQEILGVGSREQIRQGREKLLAGIAEVLILDFSRQELVFDLTRRVFEADNSITTQQARHISNKLIKNIIRRKTAIALLGNQAFIKTPLEFLMVFDSDVKPVYARQAAELIFDRLNAFLTSLDFSVSPIVPFSSSMDKAVRFTGTENLFTDAERISMEKLSRDIAVGIGNERILSLMDLLPTGQREYTGANAGNSWTRSMLQADELYGKISDVFSDALKTLGRQPENLAVGTKDAVFTQGAVQVLKTVAAELLGKDINGEQIIDFFRAIAGSQTLSADVDVEPEAIALSDVLVSLRDNPPPLVITAGDIARCGGYKWMFKAIRKLLSSGGCVVLEEDGQKPGRVLDFRYRLWREIKKSYPLGVPEEFSKRLVYKDNGEFFNINNQTVENPDVFGAPINLAVSVSVRQQLDELVGRIEENFTSLAYLEKQPWYAQNLEVARKFGFDNLKGFESDSQLGQLCADPFFKRRVELCLKHGLGIEFAARNDLSHVQEKIDMLLSHGISSGNLGTHVHDSAKALEWYFVKKVLKSVKKSDVGKLKQLFGLNPLLFLACTSGGNLLGIHKDEVVGRTAARISFLSSVNKIGGNTTQLEVGNTALFFDSGMASKSMDNYFSGWGSFKVVEMIKGGLEKGILPWIPELIRRDMESGRIGLIPIKVDGRDAVFVTHAHLDHIGNLFAFDPDVLIVCSEECKTAMEEFAWQMPGSVSKELIEVKDRSDMKKKPYPRVPRNIFTFSPGKPFAFGSDGVTILPLRVGHSISANAFVVSTPAGQIVITGDYADQSHDGAFTEEFFDILSRLDNILLVVSEGTNVRAEKRTNLESEDDYQAHFEGIIDRAVGKPVITSFAWSYENRFKTTYDAAKAKGRKLVVPIRMFKYIDKLYQRGKDVPNIAADPDVLVHVPKRKWQHTVRKYLLDLFGLVTDSAATKVRMLDDGPGHIISEYGRLPAKRMVTSRDLYELYHESQNVLKPGHPVFEKFCVPDYSDEKKAADPVIILPLSRLNEFDTIEPVEDTPFVYSLGKVFSPEMQQLKDKISYWVDKCRLVWEDVYVSPHMEEKGIIEHARKLNTKYYVPVHTEEPERFAKLLPDQEKFLQPRQFETYPLLENEGAKRLGGEFEKLLPDSVRQNAHNMTDAQVVELFGRIYAQHDVNDFRRGFAGMFDEFKTRTANVSYEEFASLAQAFYDRNILRLHVKSIYSISRESAIAAECRSLHEALLKEVFEFVRASHADLDLEGFCTMLLGDFALDEKRLLHSELIFVKGAEFDSEKSYKAIIFARLVSEIMFRVTKRIGISEYEAWDQRLSFVRTRLKSFSNWQRPDAFNFVSYNFFPAFVAAGHTLTVAQTVRELVGKRILAQPSKAVKPADVSGLAGDVLGAGKGIKKSFSALKKDFSGKDVSNLFASLNTIKSRDDYAREFEAAREHGRMDVYYKAQVFRLEVGRVFGAFTEKQELDQRSALESQYHKAVLGRSLVKRIGSAGENLPAAVLRVQRVALWATVLEHVGLCAQSDGFFNSYCAQNGLERTGDKVKTLAAGFAKSSAAKVLGEPSFEATDDGCRAVFTPSDGDLVEVFCAGQAIGKLAAGKGVVTHEGKAVEIGLTWLLGKNATGVSEFEVFSSAHLWEYAMSGAEALEKVCRMCSETVPQGILTRDLLERAAVLKKGIKGLDDLLSSGFDADQWASLALDTDKSKALFDFLVLRDIFVSNVQVEYGTADDTVAQAHELVDFALRSGSPKVVFKTTGNASVDERIILNISKMFLPGGSDVMVFNAGALPGGQLSAVKAFIDAVDADINVAERVRRVRLCLPQKREHMKDFRQALEAVNRYNQLHSPLRVKVMRQEKNTGIGLYSFEALFEAVRAGCQLDAGMEEVLDQLRLDSDTGLSVGQVLEFCHWLEDIYESGVDVDIDSFFPNIQRVLGTVTELNKDIVNFNGLYEALSTVPHTARINLEPSVLDHSSIVEICTDLVSMFKSQSSAVPEPLSLEDELECGRKNPRSFFSVSSRQVKDFAKNCVGRDYSAVFLAPHGFIPLDGDSLSFAAVFLHELTRLAGQDGRRVEFVADPECIKDDPDVLYVCFFPVTDQNDGFRDEELKKLYMPGVGGKRAIIAGDCFLGRIDRLKRNADYGFDSVMVIDHHAWNRQRVEHANDVLRIFDKDQAVMVNTHFIFESAHSDALSAGAASADMLSEGTPTEWLSFFKKISVWSDGYSTFFPAHIGGLNEFEKKRFQQLADLLNSYSTVLALWAGMEGGNRSKANEILVLIVKAISQAQNAAELEGLLKSSLKSNAEFYGFYKQVSGLIEFQVRDSIEKCMASKENIYFYQINAPCNIAGCVHKQVGLYLNSNNLYGNKVIVHYYVSGQGENRQIKAYVARGEKNTDIDVSTVCLHGPRDVSWGGGHLDRAGFNTVMGNAGRLFDEWWGPSRDPAKVIDFVRAELRRQFTDKGLPIENMARVFMVPYQGSKPEISERLLFDALMEESRPVRLVFENLSRDDLFLVRQVAKGRLSPSTLEGEQKIDAYLRRHSHINDPDAFRHKLRIIHAVVSTGKEVFVESCAQKQSFDPRNMDLIFTKLRSEFSHNNPAGVLDNAFSALELIEDDYSKRLENSKLFLKDLARKNGDSRIVYVTDPYYAQFVQSVMGNLAAFEFKMPEYSRRFQTPALDPLTYVARLRLMDSVEAGGPSINNEDEHLHMLRFCVWSMLEKVYSATRETDAVGRTLLDVVNRLDHEKLGELMELLERVRRFDTRFGVLDAKFARSRSAKSRRKITLASERITAGYVLGFLRSRGIITQSELACFPRIDFEIKAAFVGDDTDNVSSEFVFGAVEILQAA